MQLSYPYFHHFLWQIVKYAAMLEPHGMVNLFRGNLNCDNYK